MAHRDKPVRGQRVATSKKNTANKAAKKKTKATKK